MSIPEAAGGGRYWALHWQSDEATKRRVNEPEVAAIGLLPQSIDNEYPLARGAGRGRGHPPPPLRLSTSMMIGTSGLITIANLGAQQRQRLVDHR